MGAVGSEAHQCSQSWFSNLNFPFCWQCNVFRYFDNASTSICCQGFSHFSLLKSVEAALNFLGLFKLPILFTWVLKERCDLFSTSIQQETKGLWISQYWCDKLFRNAWRRDFALLLLLFPIQQSGSECSQKQTAPSGGSTLANACCLFHFFRQVVSVSWQEKKKKNRELIWLRSQPPASNNYACALRSSSDLWGHSWGQGALGM